MTTLMRVLLVEDEESTIRQIRSYLECNCNAAVQVARSRDAAVTILNRDEDFDLIVCDLRIPTQDGALDVDEQHGFMVHDVAQRNHPGSFSRFFSGFVELDNVGPRLATGLALDVFGTGEAWAVVDAVPKIRQPEFLNWSVTLYQHLSQIDILSIDESQHACLGKYEARTIRIYAQKLNGSHIDISPLGGLSGSRVSRVHIRDNLGASVGIVVAKIDALWRVREELKHYRRYVAPVLAIGTFAPLAGEVLHGCGRFGAAFYSLAGDDYRDFFDICRSERSTACASIDRMRASHEHWRGRASRRLMLIHDLRSAYISDETMRPWISELDEARVHRTEGMLIDLNHHIQHGDLHGMNILIDPQNQPLIIDYGDLGEHPAALDPVTLEMSLVFHPERPDSAGWPSVGHATAWFQLTEYARDSPVPETIAACRQWALSNVSRRELAAVVYAHALRQLKYGGTNKAVAVAIARSAMTVLIDE